MFARAMHQTPDMIEQHNLLDWVAAQIDAGHIRTTVTDVLRPINAANLRRAHAALRLAHDLELSPAATALVLDLLDEIEALRSRLRRAGLE